MKARYIIFVKALINKKPFSYQKIKIPKRIDKREIMWYNVFGKFYT